MLAINVEYAQLGLVNPNLDIEATMCNLRLDIEYLLSRSDFDIGGKR